MSLVFRMLYVLLISFFRERLLPGATESRLRLRTLPNDLDINLHMNNGRYLTICDLNRVDLFIRSGLAKLMFKRGWMPMVAERTMSYKRPLKLFERFEVSMALTHWDEKFFYMTHTFTAGERVVAQGTSKAVLRSREGVLQPQAVVAALAASRGVAASSWDGR
jgi:acyl-CoA thioesterase FadM